MRDFVLMTDNMADLPDDYLRENGVEEISLTYMLDGKTYSKENSLPYPEFYNRMRSGSMPTTSQVNPEEAKEKFLKVLEQGHDIVHIAFSSGLSGSCNSTRIAAEEIMEEYPEYKVRIVDSLCASLGQGLLVHKAVQLKKQGMSMEEIVDWLENNKLHLCHVFTVDDLNHLYRGGRVSKTAAFIGTLANIKPMLHVDNQGRLIPLSKVRGRKKSINTLVTMMEDQMKSYRDQNDVIFISHGDCLEDAEYLKKLIEEKFGIHDFLIDYVGPTIGAHSGPGTLALFFMGESR